MNIALIVAGEKTLRSEPRAFMNVLGEPLFIHTLRVFVNHYLINSIVLVVPNEYRNLTKNLLDKYDFDKDIFLVEGGSSRSASVYNGLSFIQSMDLDDEPIVVIHDAVRPLVTPLMIDQNIALISKGVGVGTYLNNTDKSVLTRNGLEVIEYLDESYTSQTPQTYYLQDIVEVYEDSDEEIEDDGDAFIKHGGQILIVEGSKYNFPVKNKQDAKVIEFLLSEVKENDDE